MIHIFHDYQLTVQRLKTISGNKTGYEATATIWSDMRPMQPEKAQALNLHPTRTYRAHPAIDADVKAGDRIIWHQKIWNGDKETTRTRKFMVKVVDVPTDWLVEYKEIIIEEIES